MDVTGEEFGNGNGFGKWLVLGLLILVGILFFVTQVEMPQHKEEIVPPLVPTLAGIQAVEAVAVTEGFSLQEQQLLAQEGFSLSDPIAPMILTFDDIPVHPGDTFETISRRVRDVMAAEEPEMLEWGWEKVARPEDLVDLFNEDGTPIVGNTARWHGYFARWIMNYRPEWISSKAENTEPAVIFWTLYLQMRLHVPNEGTPGAAPWEWPGRYNWLD